LSLFSVEEFIMLHLRVHPDNPQPRLIEQAAERIRQGDIIAYFTDTAYALGCHLGDKTAMERIGRIRRLPNQHQYTLLCRDLSDIATYAKVSNSTYRLLKAHTPSLCTFILAATSETPRRLMHPKRKTIGIRVPTHPVCQALLDALGEPMLTSTLMLPDQEFPMDDPEDIVMQLSHQIDVLLDAGIATRGQTTVIDLSGDQPTLIRQGMGDVHGFLDL
jgi:tRNA threonylcarbamoyl adenosine modification protein (Sua5/YciO/YrdC/YwlC family)